MFDHRMIQMMSMVVSLWYSRSIDCTIDVDTFSDGSEPKGRSRGVSTSITDDTCFFVGFFLLFAVLINFPSLFTVGTTLNEEEEEDTDDRPTWVDNQVQR